LEDATLSYAGAGFPVFPLHNLDAGGVCTCGGETVHPKCSPGKHPRTLNGFKDATTDAERIRSWWKRWPDANIGIPTGERSGFLALDEDPRHGGYDSLRQLTKTHGELPRTKTTKTGSGGRHYLFSYPAGSGIGNSSGRLGPGLDVRGEGGYIVAPPSRTTGAYEAFDRSPPVIPPAWLSRLLTEQPGGSGGLGASGGKPSVSVEPDGEPIPEGERDDTLARIAGRLHNGERSLEQLSEDLQAVNMARCTPPLSEEQVRKVAGSIHRRATSTATGAGPETLGALDTLNTAVLDARSWKGIAGKTDRAIYRTLLLLARSYGRLLRHGVKVYVSERKLAELAGVSSRTVWKGKRRLIEAGLLARSSEGSGTKAGALVLRTPSNVHSQVRHSPTGGESPDSALLVRELLRLRWGPKKLGKSAPELLEHLAFYGSAGIAELSGAVNTRRDNVRRVLKRLEGRNLVECYSGTYTLPADFLAALDKELEESRTKESERRQLRLHALQKQAYREHLEERRRRRAPELDALGVEPDNTPDAPEPSPNREFRKLATRMRERLPEPPKEVKAAAMCRRLQREEPDVFDALRGSLRALGWEFSARSWTLTVYSPATLESALELMEFEAEPVPVVSAA
jgi:DNA-binding MarR family transcriptional regulator